MMTFNWTIHVYIYSLSQTNKFLLYLSVSVAIYHLLEATNNADIEDILANEQW